MCGILALYTKSGKVVSDQLSKGLSQIIHRGPDNQSTWISANHNVGLGHARLAIIDLIGGTQPLTNESNTIHAVVNGEFYDYERIRTKLIQQGHQFKTKSDSEIAIHLYEQQGISCLDQLRGEFAFSLWDENNQRLYAVRDRVGINPLYYAEHDGIIYIGSEIKALIASGYPAQWDFDSYFQRAFFFQNKSLFSGVKQVPPGHYLVVDQSGTKIEKYWDINYCSAESYSDTSDEEYISQVREALINATETRLRADVPVGVYLSGGLDSCAVLGLASEIKQGSIDTFTLCFEEKDYDESTTARKMAQHAGSTHHEIPITPDQLADNFFKAIWHAETTCMNAHGVAKFILSKAVHELGFRVVLTGEGSDEVFAGYSAFRYDDLKTQQSQNSQHQLEELKRANKISAGLLISESEKSLPFIKQFFGFEPSWLGPLADLSELLNSLYLPDIAKSYTTHPIQLFIDNLDKNQIADIERVHASMYAMCKSALPNYVLAILGDRMEMAHSLEGRLPFLDHILIEKLANIPVRMKIKNQTEKYILREAVKPYVIDEVYKREKHPFLTPPSVLNPKAKLHQLVQDTLRGDLFADLPFFDRRKVNAFLDSLPNVPSSEWGKTEACLMELTSLAAIQSQFTPSA